MNSLTYLLSDSARQLRRAFDTRVRTLGVTAQQARLLLHMARDEGQNQGFYAEQVEVEPITLCRMVDRMEETGLVERRRDPADRRAWRLHLTDRSRAMIERLHVCIEGLERDLLAGLSEAQRDSLRGLLEAARTNLARGAEPQVASHG